MKELHGDIEAIINDADTGMYLTIDEVGPIVTNKGLKLEINSIESYGGITYEFVSLFPD